MDWIGLDWKNLDRRSRHMLNAYKLLSIRRQQFRTKMCIAGFCFIKLGPVLRFQKRHHFLQRNSTVFHRAHAFLRFVISTEQDVHAYNRPIMAMVQIVKRSSIPSAFRSRWNQCRNSDALFLLATLLFPSSSENVMKKFSSHHSGG